METEFTAESYDCFTAPLSASSATDQESRNHLFFILLLCYDCAFAVTRSQTTVSTLTLSLPRCHLKTNDNNEKFEILTPFFVLASTSEKISVKTKLKLDLFDIGPENMLFAGMCVDFSAQKLYGLEQ